MKTKVTKEFAQDFDVVVDHYRMTTDEGQELRGKVRESISADGALAAWIERQSGKIKRYQCDCHRCSTFAAQEAA